MGTIAPLAIVPSDDADAPAVQRGEAWQPFPPEVKARAFVLWGTLAGGDAAATERLLRRELDEGEPCPTRQTIARWARTDEWAAQAAAAWRDVGTREKALFDLQMAMIANKMLAELNKRDVQTGAWDHDPMVGALRLKGAELSDRGIERVIAALKMPEPPEGAATDESRLSRQEREARASERLARRRQEGS